jgi:hypothetical protein
MEPLPYDDGILGSILFRAILLYGESENSLDIRKISEPTSQRDSGLAYDVWKESDISSVLGKDLASLSFVSCRLFTEYTELTSHGTSFTVLKFLKGWLDRITKKKARWSRLGDTISKVADKLLSSSSNIKMDTDQLPNEQSGDIDAVFSSVFSKEVEDPTDEKSRGIAISNATVHMYVLVLKSLSKNGVEVEANFPVKLDLGFCKKVS